MTPTEDYLDVLEAIESAVAQVWRQRPEMTNYSVMRAYEAAIAYYNAEARQQTPKPVNLTGLDAAIYSGVSRICESCLGRTSDLQPPESGPIPVEDLVACLRKLRKSVDFWTKQSGRQGYLQLIEQYVE